MISATEKSLPLIVGLVCLVVAFVLAAVYLLWRAYQGDDARRIARRLRELGLEADRRKNRSLQKSSDRGSGSGIPHRSQRFPWLVWSERLILQAGLEWSLARFALTSLMCSAAAGGFANLVLRQSAWIGSGLAAAAASLPLIYVLHQRKRRLARLREQLPEMLSYLAAYLRSGGGISHGLQAASEKMAQPIAGELRMLRDEINFGVPFQRAMANLAVRVPNVDLRFLVIALSINRETGGTIIATLDNLSRLIRARQTLFARIRILASEPIFSARVTVAMPFVLVGVMSTVAPGFMTPLWEDPIGQTLVQAALALMVIGIVILRKMVRVRV
jgi:tight adherence protein B